MDPNKNDCTIKATDSLAEANYYRSCSGAHSRMEGRKE